MLRDLADQREDLGAGAAAAAGLGEPRRPAAMIGAMLNQVSTLLMLVGWPHRPFCAGKGGRGADGRRALERGDQRRLLAADEGAGAFNHFDVEGEAAAQDVLAQQAVFAGLADGEVQLMHGERIFGADVDDAFGRRR